MSFACDRLQLCYSKSSDLTPAQQARRAESETSALESLRKLRFRSDGVQEGMRKDLVPPMTEVLRALTMEGTKVHLLEISGLPADAALSQTRHTLRDMSCERQPRPATHTFLVLAVFFLAQCAPSAS